MQIDPQMTPQQPPDADTVWGMLKSALPIVVVTTCTGILYHIRDALKERTWKARWAVILVSASTGAALGPLAVSLLHQYMPDASCMVHLSLGCFFGAACPRWFETQLCKLLGLTRINLGRPEDINECRMNMTPEERARHADSCVFTPDRCGGACMSCPHRKEQPHA